MSKLKPPLSRTQCIVIGGALFLAGAWCLHAAWEGRGGKTPWPLRPIAIWR